MNIVGFVILFSVLINNNNSKLLEIYPILFSISYTPVSQRKPLIYLLVIKYVSFLKYFIRIINKKQ